MKPNTAFKMFAMNFRFLLVFSLPLAILLLASFRPLKDDPNAILGVWKNGEGTGMIKIERSGDKFQGKIVWLKEPNDPATGKPKLDTKHPEKANRTRPVMGLTNMWGFVFKGNNVWDDGKIYDPKKGSTYDCTIKMKNQNTLEVRGYIGISLIGRTDTWTRQAGQ